jgi:hypothetical protein
MEYDSFLLLSIENWSFFSTSVGSLKVEAEVGACALPVKTTSLVSGKKPHEAYDRCAIKHSFDVESD